MADATPGDGGIIIIKGGSCEIDLDDNVFTHRPSNRRRQHKHDALKIKRITISGGEFDKNFPNGFTGRITITCEP